MTGYLADRSPEGSLEVAFVRSHFAYAALGAVRGAGLTAADLDLGELTVEGPDLTPRPWPALAYVRRLTAQPVARSAA